MRVLDLFSGIGGFSLGLERAGMETIAFCEIDPFCQAVLRKHWPEVPIHDDVRELDGKKFNPDIICGGYPCQPFSLAGDRRGSEDERHLWPEMFRLVKECRPAWVVGENVAGHITMGLDEVLSDLESEGYSVQTFIVPACAVDAHHRRDRLWIVANADSGRGRSDVAGRDNANRANPRRPQANGLLGEIRDECASRVVADTNTERCGKARRSESGCRPRGCSSSVSYSDESNAQGIVRRRYDPKNGQVAAERSSRLCDGARANSEWAPEPMVGRVAHGVSRRVDRLKSLGNAVVPQVVEEIGRAIMQVSCAPAPGEG